jgi:hypothetical protein
MGKHKDSTLYKSVPHIRSFIVELVCVVLLVSSTVFLKAAWFDLSKVVLLLLPCLMSGVVKRDERAKGLDLGCATRVINKSLLF